MEAHLAECVHDALTSFMHRNAAFLAERLLASFPNEVRRARCVWLRSSPLD